MRHDDDLERTIVIKPAKKPQRDGGVGSAHPLKSADAPKSPEEARKSLAALASLYRILRG
jgi:hypothetical protein